MKFLTKRKYSLRSFSISNRDARLWLEASARLGISRSEFLRQALHDRALRVLRQSKSGGKSGVYQTLTTRLAVPARNIYWQAFFYIGGFDGHRVSLQWPAQKDRISVFRAAVGVCSGGAVSGDFSLEDFMVTTAPSILNLSTVSVYIWKLV